MAKSEKTSPKKKAPVKPESSRLTAKDLDVLKKLLLLKRAEILGLVNEIEIGAFRRQIEASGDLSAMPIHMADLGSDNFEQEFAIGLADSERKLLQSIEESLERIAAGTYGICIATGKPIRKARLLAKPWAKFCVEYARAHEDEITD